MDIRSQHVVPRGNKWAVRRTGAKRVTRHFDTQQEAIDVARGFARKQRCDVVIFGRDGLIRERESCGNNSFPPHG